MREDTSSRSSWPRLPRAELDLFQEIAAFADPRFARFRALREFKIRIATQETTQFIFREPKNLFYNPQTCDVNITVYGKYAV